MNDSVYALVAQRRQIRLSVQFSQNVWVLDVEW